MNAILTFSLRFLSAEAILTALQTPLRKKKLHLPARAGLILGKALLAIALAALVMAGPVQLRSLQPIMMALYAALLADAAADLIYTIFCAARKAESSFGVYKAVSLVLGVLFFAYGVVNMQTVKPKYHTYTSQKLQTEHTFVFMADLHVGSAQPFSVTEKTVAEIKALRPDFTVLGGDIVDDYTTKEDMEKLFSLFADFETPVYYIFGNHDRQDHAEYAGGRKFTPEELESAMAANGVVILKDEFVRIAPDLTLLGREDITEGDGRADAKTLVNPEKEAFLLVADHQPVQFKEHIALGADLQVSGHTHAGQLFPLKALYSVIGYCYGDYTQNGSTLNVSAGACGWRMPLRTDAHCNYEVITLRPAA